MPVWILAATVVAAIAVGALGEHARTAMETQIQTYGRHSLVHAKSTVEETINRASSRTRPLLSQLPQWDSTDEIYPAVLALPQEPRPPYGGDVAAWVRQELARN